MKLITLTLSLIFGLLNILEINQALAQQWAGSSTTTGDINRSGNVGIGTATPGSFLEIEADADGFNGINRRFIQLLNTSNSSRASVVLGFNSGTGSNETNGSVGVTSLTYTAIAGLAGFTSLFNGTSGIVLRARDTAGIIKFWTGGDNPSFERMRITSAGDVGIGTTTPNEKLQVIGNVRANSFVNNSDKRFKTNIESIENGLVEITKLRGVRYEFNQSFLRKIGEESGPKIGFIAQEVQEVFPELVHQDNEGYLAVNYVAMIPMLVEAIKQQNNELEELRAQIQTLEEGSPRSLNSDQRATKATLFQNSPNPFNQVSQINYFLPEDSNEASIFIYNLSGKQIRRYDLRTKGHSSIEVGGFEAGMYIYTLVVDGKELGNKRLILTE